MNKTGAEKKTLTFSGSKYLEWLIEIDLFEGTEY